MKYKVGDKVRIREDLVIGGNYGGCVAVDDMTDMGGNVVTIERVGNLGYYIEEDPDEYCWTDEMFEGLVEEELTAEEAIKVLADMCARECKNCELGKLVKESRYSFCSAYRREHPDKVVEILKQWKKDHEKKEVEVTQKIYCLVVDEEREVVHEEEIGNSDSCMDVLKNYCENHDGKFFSLMEFRYEVKQ
jgi:hypothetical protein